MLGFGLRAEVLGSEDIYVLFIPYTQSNKYLYKHNEYLLIYNLQLSAFYLVWDMVVFWSHPVSHPNILIIFSSRQQKDTWKTLGSVAQNICQLSIMIFF